MPHWLGAPSHRPVSSFLLPFCYLGFQGPATSGDGPRRVTPRPQLFRGRSAAAPPPDPPPFPGQVAKEGLRGQLGQWDSSRGRLGLALVVAGTCGVMPRWAGAPFHRPVSSFLLPFCYLGFQGPARVLRRRAPYSNLRPHTIPFWIPRRSYTGPRGWHLYVPYVG